MMIKQTTRFILGLSLAVAINACAQKKQLANNSSLAKMADKEFTDAASQYNFLKTQLKPDRFPKAYFPKNDSLATSNSGCGVAVFIPVHYSISMNKPKMQHLKPKLIVY